MLDVLSARVYSRYMPADTFTAVAEYRKARDRYYDLSKRADAAFLRWFEKAQAGQPTNAAAAQRLANEASYASADVASAQIALYRLDLDPWAIDDADGAERTLVV